LPFLSSCFCQFSNSRPKNKKKQLLPDDVLRAQTVMVVIHPDAGETVTAPLANRNAQDEVERALTKWGRFDLVMDAYTADLIIAVRKGNKSGPIIAHSPADNRSVIFQPGVGDARIGQQQGRPPDLSQPLPGDMGSRGPQLGTQVFSSDDTLRCIGENGIPAGCVAGLALYRERLAECSTGQGGRGIP
jgi:hypothetical protein